jgi:hypothetical protein
MVEIGVDHEENLSEVIELLHYVKNENSPEFFLSILQNDAGVSPLHLATYIYTVDQGPLVLIWRLLLQLIPIDIQDAEGQTPLMWAALENNKKLVEYLIREGANQEIKDKEGKDYHYYLSQTAFSTYRPDYYVSPYDQVIFE